MADDSKDTSTTQADPSGDSSDGGAAGALAGEQTSRLAGLTKEQIDQLESDEHISPDLASQMRAAAKGNAAVASADPVGGNKPPATLSTQDPESLSDTGTAAVTPNPTLPASGQAVVGGMVQNPELLKAGIELMGKGTEERIAGEGEFGGEITDAMKKGATNTAQQVGAIAQAQAEQQAQAKYEMENQTVRQGAADQALQQSIKQRNDAAAVHVDPNRFWHNMSGWRKTLSFIGMALGGGRSIMQQLNAEADQDTRAQILEQEHQQTGFENTRQSTEDMRMNIADKHRQYLDGQLDRMKSLDMQLSGIDASNKGEAFQVNLAKLKNDVAQRTGELHQGYGQWMLSMMPNLKDVKPEQMAAAGYHNSMVQANNTIAQLESEGYHGTELQQQLASGRMARFAGDKAQRMEQAQNQFATSAVRSSGGRVSPEIIAMKQRELFPPPGGSANVIANALAARNTAIQNARSQAGWATYFNPAPQRLESNQTLGATPGFRGNSAKRK